MPSLIIDMSHNDYGLQPMTLVFHWKNHESFLSIFRGSAGLQPLIISPDPSHGRIFREKFCSVYMVKGIWSLLTDLLLNRFHPSPPYVCSRTWLTLIIARGNQTLACRWGFTRGPWLKQISNYIIYHIIKQRKMRDTAISLKFPPDFPLNFHADSRFTYNPNFPVDSPPTCIRHPRGFHAESAWFCPLVHVYLQR